MSYQVHTAGQTTGPFSLDELRRRRSDRGLTGHELVWCDGMPQWQTLDTVLGIAPFIPPPQKMNRWLIVGIASIVVVVACFAAIFIYTVHSFIGGFPTGMQSARNTNAPAAQTPPGGDEDSTTGVEAASQPIVFGSNTLTQSDVQKNQKTFRVRQYVDAYDKLGPHAQPWDADARAFIQGFIDTYYDPSVTNIPDINALGDKLAADPSCDDPIVLLLAGDIAVEFAASTNRIERALTAFATSDYKAYPRFYANVSLAYKDYNRANRVAALEKSALELYPQCFTDGSYTAQDQSEIANCFTTGWGNYFFKRHADEICRLTGQAGPSFHWLALYLTGLNELKKAWDARGSDWANNVTDQGWKGFNQHIEKAQSAFSKAVDLRPDLPQAAAEMIDVAMQSDANSVRQWFDLATKAQIDYEEAWRMERWALRPRWQGSLQAMRDLGIAAVDSRRFDTDVPRQFFDSVSDIENDTQLLPGQHIYGRADIWPVFKRMYEGYIAAPSQVRDADGWRGSYAIVAYFAKQYGVARQQLEKLDWQVPSSKLEAWGKDISLFPLEVAARTGPQGKEIAEAEDAYDRCAVADALGLYQKLSPSVSDARTQDFVRHRIASLTLELRLQGGDWVDFLPKSTNDLNWIFARGDCTVLPDGALEVKSGPTGSMIYSRVRIGEDFEIRGTCEVVSSTTGAFQAGIEMGFPELNHTEWYEFRMKRNPREGQIVSYSKGWGASKATHRVKLNDTINSFDFALQNQKASAVVNKKPALANARFPGTASVPDNQFLVGLGAYNHMNTTVIRYSNIQIHRLPAAPVQ